VNDVREVKVILLPTSMAIKNKLDSHFVALSLFQGQRSELPSVPMNGREGNVAFDRLSI
jgi:hypothetical protein